MLLFSEGICDGFGTSHQRVSCSANASQSRPHMSDVWKSAAHNDAIGRRAACRVATSYQRNSSVHPSSATGPEQDMTELAQAPPEVLEEIDTAAREASTSAPSIARPAQEAEIEQLRHACGPEVDAQLRQGGEEGLTDATLRRWLVARKWNVEKAASALKAHAAWRAAYVPDGCIPEVMLPCITFCWHVCRTPTYRLPGLQVAR